MEILSFGQIIIVIISIIVAFLYGLRHGSLNCIDLLHDEKIIEVVGEIIYSGNRQRFKNEKEALLIYLPVIIDFLYKEEFKGNEKAAELIKGLEFRLGNIMKDYK